jgi:acetoin utilization deacetylase AcuC-like enzyme
MKIFYADHFRFPLPEGHRFPGEKYTLLRERIQHSGLIPSQDMLVPAAATDEQLLRVHHKEYLQRVLRGELTDREIRRLGLPWSPELVERSRRSVGGTIEACRQAIVDGLAIHIAGGTHHAFPDHGEGFCLFNDCAVAARAMQAEGKNARLVIIDCDVHQGNGTAAIFRNDPTVFTFSIHGAKNYPFRKQPSDLDVPLPDNTSDEDYLKAVDAGVRQSLQIGAPDLVIYLAGADPYTGDRLGRMDLSKDGLASRDELVLNLSRQRNLPVAVVMSGGYGEQIEDTVDIHFQTVQIAARIDQQSKAEIPKNDHL